MDENERKEYTGEPEPAAGTPDHSPVEGDWTAEPYPEEPVPRAASQEAPPPPPEPPQPPRESAPFREEPPRRDPPPQAGPAPARGGKPPRKKKEKRGLGAAAVIGLCLVCALIGGFAGSAVQHLAGTSAKDSFSASAEDRSLPAAEEGTSEEVKTEELPAAETASLPAAGEMTPAQIYENYVNSTVGITVDIVSTNIWGQTVTGAAAGSGFVVSEDGYIVTNYHVINDANAVTVAFSDGKTYPATVIGGEAQNDVAVIKIEATGLKPVVLGKSGDLKVGENVVAIGNPLGELTFTETHGIVSALNRVITTSASERINMIQTDCAINSGSSGGPLFNSRGQVVGITTAKPSIYAAGGGATVEGITFAIPVDDVSAMVKDLMEKGYVTGKPYLGIVMSQYGVDQAAQMYGIPAGVPVLGVAEGLAAAQAGIQENDIIVKVNGVDTPTGSELGAELSKTKPGDEIPFTIYRNGQIQELTVTIGEETVEAREATQKVNDALQEKQKKEQEEQQSQQGQQGQQSGGYGSFPYSWPFGFGF